MPRKKAQSAPEPVRDISEFDEKPVHLKDGEDESDDDPSPKKIASDDDEEVAELGEEGIADDAEESEDDDPIKDFLTEEDSW